MASPYHDHYSEQEPLLARRPLQGQRVALTSNTHSDKRSNISPAFDTSIYSPEQQSLSKSSFPKDRSFSTYSFQSLSLTSQIIIGIMVAIPTYLLASSAATSLGPLTHYNSVIRSPQPDPLPQPSSTSTSESGADASDPFASVVGPHISSNFPDPAIIYFDGVSYAFATHNKKPYPNHINIQVATSTDNQTWTLMDSYDALPSLGAWETGAGVWAPDVVQLNDGTFVLYYADNAVWSPAHHCVGAATSSNILGPYTPSKTPFACPDTQSQGGAIDPDGFLDESTGKRYVVYKVDGNSIGHGGSCGNTVEPIVPTPLMLQEVAEDGVTPIGGAVQLLDRDESDGPLIEAPSLHRSDEGVYFLFYSSNCFTTPKYDVAYATSTNILGPYTKASRPLLVTSDADLTGPGGMDIIKGGSMILFHGHMTVNNDPALKAAVAQDKSKAKALPLVRGMWSGTATFSGTNVLLNG